MQGQIVNFVLECIPVFLSLILLVKLGSRWEEYTPTSKLRAVFVSVACCILLFSQFSWWWSSLIQGNQTDIWFVDKLWIIFNAIVLSIFLSKS